MKLVGDFHLVGNNCCCSHKGWYCWQTVKQAGKSSTSQAVSQSVRPIPETERKRELISYFIDYFVWMHSISKPNPYFCACPGWILWCERKRVWSEEGSCSSMRQNCLLHWFEKVGSSILTMRFFLLPYFLPIASSYPSIHPPTIPK